MAKPYSIESDDSMGPGPKNETRFGEVFFMPKRWDKDSVPGGTTPGTLSADQLTSISAMIAYVSHRCARSEYRIERMIADRFKVPNAKCLSSDDFDNVIRYLADILPSKF